MSSRNFFNSGYLFTAKSELLDAAEAIPGGNTCRQLFTFAEKYQTAIIAGMPEVNNNLFYNSSVLIKPDGDYTLYRKTHLFDRETLFFEPGNTGFQVTKYKDINIGMMICFDWFFPESARCLSLMGADVIAHPANLVLPFCPDAMITRCIENRVFAITCNRVGTETKGIYSLSYIGKSQIVSPGGIILANADSSETVAKSATINVSESRNKKIADYNHLFADRRVTFYKKIVE